MPIDNYSRSAQHLGSLGSQPTSELVQHRFVSNRTAFQSGPKLPFTQMEFAASQLPESRPWMPFAEIGGFEPELNGAAMHIVICVSVLVNFNGNPD